MTSEIIAVVPDSTTANLFIVHYRLSTTGASNLYATIHAKDELDAFKKIQAWMVWRETQHRGWASGWAYVEQEARG